LVFFTQSPSAQEDKHRHGPVSLSPFLRNFEWKNLKMRVIILETTEVRRNGGAIDPVYRILRNAREKSYGHIQAEAMGITKELMRSYLLEEVSSGLYPVEDTRLNIKH
jgi:hypothetical protein